MRISVYILFILTLFACDRDIPVGILSESDYEKIFIEIRILSEYRTITSDSVRSRLLADSIFLSYGISEETFNKSHAWYEQDHKTHARRLSRLADSLSVLDTQISTPDY